MPAYLDNAGEVVWLVLGILEFFDRLALLLCGNF